MKKFKLLERIEPLEAQASPDQLHRGEIDTAVLDGSEEIMKNMLFRIHCSPASASRSNAQVLQDDTG
jgi:hypothetical protein